MDGLMSSPRAPPSPSGPRMTIHSEISPAPLQMDGGRPSRSLYASAKPPRRVRFAQTEITPAEDEAPTPLPGSYASSSSPVMGRFANPRTTQSKIIPADDETDMLLPSPRGTSTPPRRGRIAHSVITPAEDKAPTPSPPHTPPDTPRAGPIDQLRSSVPPSEAENRSICARARHLFTSSNLTKEQRLMRNSCCKMFAAMCMLGAGGVVGTEVNYKVGLGLMIVGGAVGISATSDAFFRPPNAPGPQGPTNLVKRRRNLHGGRRMERISEQAL